MLTFYDTSCTTIIVHLCNSLGFEPLGDEGVCAITSALKENSTLVDLSYVINLTIVLSHVHIQYQRMFSICMRWLYSLSRTEFSVEGLKYMTEVIPQNKKLEVVR